MHPRMQRLVFAATVVALTACGRDVPVSPTDILAPSESDGTTANYAVTLADGTTQITVGEVVTLRASTTVRRSRTIRWSSTNTSVVSVSSTGTITGRAAGTGTVTALGSNGSRSTFPIAVVSVTERTAPVVASVEVSAPSVAMAVGGTLALTATPRDAAGAAITGRSVVWSVAVGQSVTVSASGVVTAVTAGSSNVRATVDGVAGLLAITVAAPTVTALAISPKTSVTLAPAQTRQFSTSAVWSDLATRAVSVTYSATGGTISSSGLYTAGQLAGTFMVIASCGCGHADTAAVVVASSSTPTAQLTTLTISPKAPTLNAGATQQFAATANWTTGATTLPPITYSATGGSVSAAGLYTAPTVAGTYRVIVAHTGGTLKDTAVVTVPPTGGDVAPPTPTDFTSNLPSGLALVTDSRFGNLRTDQVLNADALAFAGEGQNAIDNSAPFGSGVYQINYPGNDAGNGVGGGQLWGQDGQKWRKVYFSIMIWVPSDYSMHSNGEKFFYPLVTTPGESLQSSAMNWKLLGSETPSSATFGFALDAQTGMDGSSFVQPSSSTVRVTKGKWTRVEMYCAMNSPGQRDGVWRVWIDGQIAADFTTVRYSHSAVQSYFDGIRFPGTRGGGASTALTPAGGQFRRYDRLAFFASNN